jgi:hypothetical protein
VTEIPGADELLGKGVYRGMPKHIPQPVRDGHAVTFGRAAACAAAARRLSDAGWAVTVVTGDSACACNVRCDYRLRVVTEVACASGIEYLEALVLRRIGTGRIEAFNASALFIL